MQAESIGVLTLTRRRPELLRRRAMASVFAQDFDGTIEHVVIIDDDPDSLPAIEAAPSRPGLRVVPYLIPRPPAEADEQPGDRRSSYPRLCRMLNAGARFCSTDWIAVLDDDNEYEPNHLSSLMTCAKANDARAVHSARQMFTSDGAPYLDELWHTVADLDEATRIYELMCDRGVRIRGTNILLDRADADRSVNLCPSSVIQADDPVLLVDQNVWLIRRELMLEFPWPEEFSEEDYQNNAGPDDKFLEVLLANDVPIIATGQPTVRYYLGGMSNKYRREHQPITVPVTRPATDPVGGRR